MPHDDIRIGTVAMLDKGASYVRQVLAHGFESVQMFAWQKLGDVDLERVGREVTGAVGDRAVVSSLGLFGNVLVDGQCMRDFARCIDACKYFNCALVTGFAGAIEGSPIPESMRVFKKVWGELARRAADAGVRIAWDTSEMGGTWNTPRFNIAHSPAAWEMMFNELPDKHLGLEWEPAHQLLSLVDPIAQLRKWASSGRIFHLHGKDASVAWDVIHEYGLRGGHQYAWHRLPGFGDTNWADVISLLRMNRWRGSIDIEGWHDPVYRDDLETTGQVAALHYLRRCRGGEFVPNPR